MERLPRLPALLTVCLALLAGTAAVVSMRQSPDRATAAALPVIGVGPGGMVDASLYGVRGDGIDCTSSLQNVVAQVVALGPGSGAWIQLPPGTIRVSATVDYGAFGRVILRGTGSTLITGNVAGPLVGRNLAGTTGSGSVTIRDIDFYNAHPFGECVTVNVVTHSQFERCNFKGYRGLTIGKLGTGNNNYNALYHCHFDGSAAIPGEIGFLVNNGDTTLVNVSGTGWLNCCLQLTGFVRIFGGAFEENATAIRTGTKPDGTDGPCCLLANGVRFEACLVSLQLRKPTYFSTVTNFRILGDAQGGVTYPTFGVSVEAGAGPVSFSEGLVDGSYATAAISTNTSLATKYSRVNAINQGHAAGGSTTAWREGPGVVIGTTMQVEQTNHP